MSMQHLRRYSAVLLCLLSLLAFVPRSTTGQPLGQKLHDVLNIRIVAGDSRATLFWQLKPEQSQSGMTIKGIRVYQLKEGLETGYRLPLTTLVADRQLADSPVTVSKLVNGEQYVFQLKAYNEFNQEILETSVVVFPGTVPGRQPAKPTNVYAVSGDSRVAVYWKRNTESDLLGYEVYRSSSKDQEYHLVGRCSKIVRLGSARRIDRVPHAIAPGMFVDTNVKNGMRYQYRLRAVTMQGRSSEFSEVVTGRPEPYQPPDGRNVLLLVNANQGYSQGNRLNDSELVAQHYATLRGVPQKNILRLSIGGRLGLGGDTQEDYELFIQKPIQRYLMENNLLETVHYLVPCYGIPVRFAGRALDSRLADLFDRFSYGRQMGTSNPYYNSNSHFDGTYGTYLVSRLDGPTVGIAVALVDKALAAEKSITARSGAAYLASYGRKKDDWNSHTADSAARLGVRTVLKHPDFFSREMLPDDCYWYYAWRHPYRKIRTTPWPVGAVGAHLISNSMQWIRNDRKYGTSWVQGLLDDGITATFGAVIEPYREAYTRPDIFFPRFWSGEFNFAESFMMATPTVQWAMSAVGDPLYRLARPVSGGGKR